MESLANLESFVRSAELRSFSAAARRLGLTPAGVSRNVAALEANLKLRLFHRSTRKLTLTEAGERFLISIRDHLEQLQMAIADASTEQAKPAGILKISMGPTFGIGYILPLLPEFMKAYPLIRPEWMFENRQVDLIAEGYDAAIGGGFELAQGIVSRPLAPAHLIAVASPDYMRNQVPPTDPSSLAALDGIVMRSLRTGRITERQMRNAAGELQTVSLKETIILNDPAAMRASALLGLGVTLIAKPDALPDIESGRLVRLLPSWWVDAGPISIYYASRNLLPSKTRVFIDFVVEHFEREGYPKRFAGSLG
ncbi:LysR family transcriptional regulator [Rhizobium sophorae]|uniref:HTH-type transcriptional regulator TtuA n=1 Tax=Rhizobium sophorae TaxID=1535242 RepID=A0A7Y3SG94_9HYPH|nr:LysR family transcriptional regulator [Rhizobium sophorae]MBX4859287.1 LysR family transcriptional regulator [Rhizobium bangladeshense]NKK70845.1 LysR family transcriptional regulator [Rhizobium leguminosarum bv. viciae]NKL33255.1 LysR family transcriptional regulator [Rhizobium leguminosarum bv. viciae]NNU41642.1 LysR family transcriptional regulator [Rhizobium sophorae]